MSNLTMSMFASEADLELAKQAQDAKRYRFLAARMLAADFDFNGEGVLALIFEMPAGFRVSADCDDTVDSAMEAAAEDNKTADLFASQQGDAS